MAWIVNNRLQPYTPTRTEPYITEKIRAEIEQKYFPRYPTKRAALLPLFHLIMHEYGFIAAQAIDEAATLLQVPAAEVQDAASFYEEFRFEPSGKYVVNVCRSIACELCGSEQIFQRIKEVFGVENFETTDDNLFTLFEVECIGLCEKAPAALINGEIHGPLTPDGFIQTLKELPKEPSHHGNGHGH
ncbi:MAG TPA: NAD(P)H-dependent oxidoreductase subunit E [Phycisphaerae bacterium]|nr:NAD(P)H-dependent oxidoreductase subunit E [Phycisphaerae bacterium]